MGNILNGDFTEFIEALNKAEVSYILVGGYAVIFYGYNRTTGDLDIWVNPNKDNYKKLQKAFEIFQMPVFDMTEEKFLSIPHYDVFTFGRPPVEIDIITDIKGLDFESTWRNAQWVEYDGIRVKMIDKIDLRTAKRAAGRSKDLSDLENLFE